MRHLIDAGFSFFHPDVPRFNHLAQIGMNRGQNRECVTEALGHGADQLKTVFHRN